jgi:hypothetical protein
MARDHLPLGAKNKTCITARFHSQPDLSSAQFPQIEKDDNIKNTRNPSHFDRYLLPWAPLPALRGINNSLHYSAFVHAEKLLQGNAPSNSHGTMD